MFSLYDIYCIFTFSTSFNSNENKAQYNILYVGEKRQLPYTWLVTGLYLATLQILSTCEMLKLEIPIDLVSFKSIISSIA